MWMLAPDVGELGCASGRYLRRWRNSREYKLLCGAPSINSVPPVIQQHISAVSHNARPPLHHHYPPPRNRRPRRRALYTALSLPQHPTPPSSSRTSFSRAFKRRQHPTPPSSSRTSFSRAFKRRQYPTPPSSSCTSFSTAFRQRPHPPPQHPSRLREIPSLFFQAREFWVPRHPHLLLLRRDL